MFMSSTCSQLPDSVLNLQNYIRWHIILQYISKSICFYSVKLTLSCAVCKYRWVLCAPVCNCVHFVCFVCVYISILTNAHAFFSLILILLLVIFLCYLVTHSSTDRLICLWTETYIHLTCGVHQDSSKHSLIHSYVVYFSGYWCLQEDEVTL